MSHISQERGCGKATMYVITEKGLETGPIVYGKETDSRVLCRSNGHIYNTEREKHITNSRNLVDKRCLSVVDLSNSLLPSESVSAGRSEKLANKDVDNRSLANFRPANRTMRRSSKERLDKNKLKMRNGLEESINLDLEMLEQDPYTRNTTGQNLETRKNTPKRVNSDEQFSIAARQNELRKLQIKRKSELVIKELARWRKKSWLNNNDTSPEIELEKMEREKKMLRQIFYPRKAEFGQTRQNTNNTLLPHLSLPYLKNTNLAQCRSKERKLACDNSTNKINSNPQTNRKLESMLIFVKPNTLYNEVKTELSTTKLNIDGSTSVIKSKIRFPSVIDQRTGEVHSVPGVVTYGPCDYNRWSRKRNIVRKTFLQPPSPSVTYVSIFPSIPEK